MITEFNMRDPRQVLDLAMRVQTDVYWDEHYYLNEGNTVQQINASVLLDAISGRMDTISYVKFNDRDIDFVYDK